MSIGFHYLLQREGLEKSAPWCGKVITSRAAQAGGDLTSGPCPVALAVENGVCLERHPRCSGTLNLAPRLGQLLVLPGICFQ